MDLTSSIVTITAPSGVDGRSGVAVLNDTGSSDFVGYLFDTSGFDGPPVRTSMDDVVEGPGAVFGDFHHGARPFTIEVQLRPSSTYALSNDRRDKLYRAFNAMAADGTIEWTEAGSSQKRITFRREQPPRGPDKEGKVLLAGICADARIYAGGSETTASAGTSLSLTNSGNVSTPPRFTVASPSAGITFTNSTTGESLTFSGLDGSGTLTVDFLNRTAVRGSDNKIHKISWPSSVWWELIPGANTVSVTNAATPFFRSAWI